MSDDHATELSCAEVEELLPLVAEGAIEPEDDPGLFAHLAECGDCQSDLAIHDLTTLALSHGREPAPAEADGGAEVIRLPWPAVAGGVLLAAGLMLAAWSAWVDAGEVAEAPVAEPSKQVVEVRREADGSEVIVLEQDGELIEVRRIDQGDERAEGDGSAATPVAMPRRR